MTPKISPQETVAKTATVLVRNGLAKSQTEAERKVANALRRQDNIDSNKGK